MQFIAILWAYSKLCDERLSLASQRAVHDAFLMLATRLVNYRRNHYPTAYHSTLSPLCCQHSLASLHHRIDYSVPDLYLADLVYYDANSEPTYH